jgi:hypothetical protein
MAFVLEVQCVVVWRGYLEKRKVEEGESRRAVDLFCNCC